MSIESIKALLEDVHARKKRYLEPLDFTAFKRERDMPWNDTMTLGTAIWHIVEHEVRRRGEPTFFLALLVDRVWMSRKMARIQLRSENNGLIISLLV